MSRSALALILSLSVVTCEKPVVNREWLGRVDTLESGMVRVHNPDIGLWRDLSEWRLVADLRIGAREGTGHNVFSVVRDLDVDSAGRIFVLDGSANEVRVFDQEGRFVRAFGRSGDGPGEFRMAAGLALGLGGTLWVADPLADRYTLFDTTGTVLGQASPGIYAGSWPLIFPWQGAVDTTGQVYDYTAPASGPRLIRFGPRPSPMKVDSLDAPFTTVPELRLVDANGELRASMTLPFAPEVVRYIDRAGNLWFGSNGHLEIFKRNRAGDTLRVIDRESESVPVSKQDEAEALSSTRTFVENGGRVEGLAIPSVKPAYRWFVVDDRGYLWVNPFRSYPDETRALEVFDADGRYLGPVRADFRLDQSFRPVILGDMLYTIQEDELGVQYVVRAQIAGRQ